jgi:hypothetical protein
VIHDEVIRKRTPLPPNKKRTLRGAFFLFCVPLFKYKESAKHCHFSIGTPYAYLSVIGLNLFEGAFYGNRKHDANQPPPRRLWRAWQLAARPAAARASENTGAV